MEAAKENWRISAERRFSNSFFSLPPDETEFIPLPAG
jgi:hypothetical protein